MAMEKTRIQKVLAAAGVASRRAVEDMVLTGRITVNGREVRTLPCFVGADDDVRVDGKRVRRRTVRKVYYLLNKPRGVVCTQRDEPQYDRRKAVDLVPKIDERIYCVGRLDADSTGLIILTNDGELTHRLTHARYGVVKTYVARVAGRVTGADADALRRGTAIDGRRTSAAKVKVLRRGGSESLLEIRISEGRNRQVRRMLARRGHNCRRLHRSGIGPITDRGLKIGRHRRLAAAEVAALRKVAGL